VLNNKIEETKSIGLNISKLISLVLGVMMISLGFFHGTYVYGADWKFLQKADEGEFLYDAENITHSAANTIGIWLKIVYSDEYKEKEGLGSLTQTVGLWEIDCPNKKVCLLSMSHFSKGEEISPPRVFLPPEWKSIASGTIMDTLYKTLCK
jgi:hypothetical protein